MSFPRYPEYQSTPDGFIGDIPAHWDVSRLGYEAWVRARLGWKGLKAEEYVDDGFVLLSTPNIKRSQIDFTDVNYIDERRYEESPEIKLRVGDVLLAKDGSTLGTVNVLRDLPRPATVNSSIAVITPAPRLDSLFLNYVLMGSSAQQTIALVKGGMGVPHLFQDDIGRFFIPIPPLTEQQAISRFLDQRLCDLDALIAEQERLIELLKEKLQATITHAVTKGLDRNVPMKPSGVEWLGEVPAHWRLSRLRWSAACGSGESAQGLTISEAETELLSIPVFGGNGIMAYADRSNTDRDVVAVGRVGAQCGNVHLVRPPSWVTDNALSVIPRDDSYELPYLALVLQARRLNDLASRTAQPLLTSTQILSEVLPIPPELEQGDIVSFVTMARAKSEELVATGARAISLLRERRTALISAAVTGKIDVRNHAKAASA